MKAAPGLTGALFSFPGYDVFLPLVCHRCGNCCRGYFVPVDFEGLPEAAAALGVTIHFLQEELNRRLVLLEKGDPADCLFLKGSECLIHRVKPEPCRDFPALTDQGAGTVDCPGHREFKRVERKLMTCAALPEAGRQVSAKKPRGIPGQDIPAFLDLLAKAKASPALVRQFIVLNSARA